MSEPNPVPHSVRTSLLLHLLPGLLIGAVYYLLAPVLGRLGYPSILALMCALALALVPFELGLLLAEGRKLNGRLSLRGVISYRRPIPARQYLLWVPLLFILIGLIFTLLKPLDAFLQRNLFPWVPALESGLQGGYSRQALIVTYAVMAVFGMLIGPWIEELYFRGFLLPRMGYAGKWAPLLHSLLFGLYHAWTPWMFLTRTLGMLPLVYAVQKRNLNLAIIVHILVNAIDVITAAIFIAGMG